MAKYAENTTVTAEKSRSEIESTLRRYGADAFSYGWESTRALISFRAEGRVIRFEINMPDPEDEEFTIYMRGSVRYLRDESAARNLWEKASRQKWRALALVVKAKLEAVDAGISVFEDEFMANIVLPDNRTVGEWVKPQIAKAYVDGKMPKLLPAKGGNESGE